MRLITWIIIAFIVGVSCVAVPGMAQTTQPSTRPIISIDINYADGTPFNNIIEPSILKAVQAALDALKPKAILLSAAWKNAKNGVCEFQPGDVVIVDKPITYHGPGFIGCKNRRLHVSILRSEIQTAAGKIRSDSAGIGRRLRDHRGHECAERDVHDSADQPQGFAECEDPAGRSRQRAVARQLSAPALAGFATGPARMCSMSSDPADTRART
jgi:hypothetical protein